MRHYQRGIGTVIILSLLLIVGVAVASAVFVFDQSNKASSVNSFEDCAGLYPVMESYPAQCNTPDGKHFVQELTQEEKRGLVPPTQSPSMQACTLEAKICPDGSSVGRSGPNCEFAACPGE